MKILIVDGQGGKLGAQVVSLIKQLNKDFEIIAIGTNSIATQAMLKAGAAIVATGENPILVNSKLADIIIGPIGIVIADSLHGEVTPKMALAISQANARRILIPINKCDNIIVGVNPQSMTDIFEDIKVCVDNIYKKML